jgi:DNA-binding NarL/FixJ family response regulator
MRGWGFETRGATADVARAERLIGTMRPDVVMLELDVATRGDGTELARRLLAHDADAPILIYTGVADERVLRDVVTIGARGVLTKHAPAHELHDALDAVAGGRRYLDHRLGPLLVARAGRPDGLSEREREVLTMLAAGSTGEEIANELFLSPETVRTHVRNAMEKLGASTRTHAIALAIERGEIEVAQGAGLPG